MKVRIEQNDQRKNKWIVHLETDARGHGGESFRPAGYWCGSGTTLSKACLHLSQLLDDYPPTEGVT